MSLNKWTLGVTGEPGARAHRRPAIATVHRTLDILIPLRKYPYTIPVDPFSAGVEIGEITMKSSIPLGTGAVVLALVAATTLPAHAGSATGYRACGTSDTVGLPSSSFSDLGAYSQV